ncbi:MAG: alpha/beta hydrolase, partial [Gemmatimonas sp.]
SPFFQFAVPARRKLLLPIAGALGAVLPWGVDSVSVSPRYGESLLAEHKGEWTYDRRWKPLRGFPVYFGWVRAIRAAQAKAARGLALDIPVLVMHSSRSMATSGAWNDEYRSHDIVLDVADMKRVGPTLGRDVTMREIPNGVHDLFLSPAPARDQALGAALAWLDARFPVSSSKAP